MATLGYVGGKIVAGGFARVDKVFPGEPATFRYEEVSTTLCPKRVDRVEAFAAPGF